MAKDPVCGMDVNESDAAGESQHRGATYYFCSSGCRERFESDPEKYVAGESPEESMPRQ